MSVIRAAADMRTDGGRWSPFGPEFGAVSASLSTGLVKFAFRLSAAPLVTSGTGESCTASDGRLARSSRRPEHILDIVEVTDTAAACEACAADQQAPRPALHLTDHNRLTAAAPLRLPWQALRTGLNIASGGPKTPWAASSLAFEWMPPSSTAILLRSSVP